MFSEEATANIIKAKQELQNLIGYAEVFNYYSAYGNKEPSLVENELSDIVIAGGVISSLLRKEPHNDIDVFILNTNKRNPRATLDLLMNHKPGKWTVRFHDPKYNTKGKVMMTAFNDVTKVQYIVSEHTNRKELLEHFDYLHCTASYVPMEQKLYITPETYNAIRSKFLIVNNPDNIAAWRTEKFHKRGWRDCDLEILHEAEDKIDGLIKANQQIFNADDDLDKALEELLK